MTDNQVKQMMKMMTQCVNGIQRLEKDMSEVKTDVSELKTDVAELKTDVAELKKGQQRLEKSMDLNSRAFNELAGDSLQSQSSR